MATYFFNDKDKVETTMYRQVLEDAKKDLNNKLSIEMDLYPKAAEIAEDLIKQYSINTGRAAHICMKQVMVVMYMILTKSNGTWKKHTKI